MAHFLQYLNTYLVTIYKKIVTTLVTTLKYLVTTTHTILHHSFLKRVSLVSGNKINNYLIVFSLGMIVGWIFSYYSTLRQCGYVF